MSNGRNRQSFRARPFEIANSGSLRMCAGTNRAGLHCSRNGGEANGKAPDASAPGTRGHRRDFHAGALRRGGIHSRPSFRGLRKGIQMTDPEEAVRLQGYGEMTLRTAIATVMTLPAQARSDAAIFRVRDASRLTAGEIAALASDWGIRSDVATGPEASRPWTVIVRGMVREAPLPSLLVAFLVGVLVARR